MGKYQKILVIVGPTSSGKSGLGVTLAKKFGGEIVSADSRQVYRGLDIGTGKISRREMRGVPHHLLDIAAPRRTFTAYEFTQKARAAVIDITARGALPVVCGGTGFYIDAMLGRVVLPNVRPNPELRAKLENRSVEELFRLLKKKAPRRARTMNESERNNKVRLVRALEVALSPDVTEVRPLPKVRPLYDVLWIGIAPPLPILEKKIRARLMRRMRQGMIAEAKKLHARGLSYARMEELGLEYRYLAEHLRERCTREQMVGSLPHAIRTYAKRQMTYWKRNPDIQWFHSPKDPKIAHTVSTWLKATSRTKVRGRARVARSGTTRGYR